MKNERGTSMGWRREVSVAAVSFVVSLAVLPALAATAGVMSGQAMFLPVLAALFTYFLPYTVAGSAAVTCTVLLVRAAGRWLRRRR